MPRASITITKAEAARMVELSAYFDQSVKEFLRDVFRTGMGEAESHREMRETPPLFDKVRPVGRYEEDLDDGIPF